MGFEPDEFGVAAQDLRADRVEGAEPWHALDHAADERRRRARFISRAALLVKVTARISLGRARPVARIWAMRDGEHARLAGAGAGQHQHRAVERLDRGRCSGLSPSR